MKDKFKKRDFVIWILIAAGLIIYISLIFNDSLWEDEAFTMLMIKKDFCEIIKITALDVHPPLYYLIAKIVTMIFGYSVSSAKLASILPVILSIIFVSIKCKQLFKDNSRLISIIFSLLILFSPRAFSVNIELRMYTWAMFFVTASGIYAYEIYKKPNRLKSMVLFIICSLCAAYTHYYAAVSEGFIYLYLIVALFKKDKSNLEKCLKIIIFTIIGYLPWIPVFIRQFIIVRDTWWLQTFTTIDMLYSVRWLFYGEFVYLFLILIFFIVIGLIVYLKNNENDEDATFSLLAVSVFVMTILLGFFVSILIRPLFLNRYMYPACGLLFLGVGIAISKNKYKNILRNLLIGVIVLSIPFSYKTAFLAEYRTGTEELKKFIEDNISSAAIISTDSYELYWSLLPYYLRENNIEYKPINDNYEKYIFTEKDIEEVKKIIPKANVNKIFNGNIDNMYEFNIYYIE